MSSMNSSNGGEYLAPEVEVLEVLAQAVLCTSTEDYNEEEW